MPALLINVPHHPRSLDRVHFSVGGVSASCTLHPARALTAGDFLWFGKTGYRSPKRVSNGEPADAKPFIDKCRFVGACALLVLVIRCQDRTDISLRTCCPAIQINISRNVYPKIVPKTSGNFEALKSTYALQFGPAQHDHKGRQKGKSESTRKLGSQGPNL